MAEIQFWLHEGTMVGERYRLDKVLGVGGYGITYRGLDTRLDRIVAIKEYFPSFCASRFTQQGPALRCQAGLEADYEKGRERFLEEAKTLASLSNIQGIVRVNDYFEENATAYLVMDFLDGKNLKQMSDGFGGRIPADILIPVLSPTIAALQKVHDRGMIHRDISPDNIMMLEDGSVYLIDFGNARESVSDHSMTLAMKQGFAAPEQYRTRGQGTWTDVYGLCATMYYCLTGKLPPQALERLTGTPFLKPSEMGVQIEPHLEEAIMDGLELYVNKRIQTMNELWTRLYTVPQAPTISNQSPLAVPVQPSAPEPDASPMSYGSAAHRSMVQRASAQDGLAQEGMVQEYSPTVRLDCTHQSSIQGESTRKDLVHGEDKSAFEPEIQWDKVVSAGLQRIRSLCTQIYQKMKEL